MNKNVRYTWQHDRNVRNICNIYLTKMLVTHGKMQHTSDKNVKYTWQNVTYI